MRYTVVLEQTPNNWSAYVPDVGGCISTGKTRQEVERNIREALELHFEALRADNVPIPPPGTWTATIDVDVRDRESADSSLPPLLMQAPFDDEPESDEERAGVLEAEDDIAQGRVISHERARRRLLDAP
jgi:predicted RNase H-like HicB family nuclease